MKARSFSKAWSALGCAISVAAFMGIGCEATVTSDGAGGSGASTASSSVATTIGASTSGSGGSGGSGVTIDEVQTKVFSFGCQGGGPMNCHGRGPFDGDLDLRPGHARAALVSRLSKEAPGKTLVIPGDRDQSFLWQKLTNALPADDSEGKPMPQGEGIMWSLPPEDQLDAVTAWIESGAH
jgi:hypothetical protein